MSKPARVNFRGTTAIPRENTRGEEFLSCFAPIRDSEKHALLNFVVNSDEEFKEVIEVGVVNLDELTTVEKPYVSKDGDELMELTTNLGAIRTRGEW